MRIARLNAMVGFLEDLCAAMKGVEVELEVEAEARENEEDDEDASPSYVAAPFMKEYFFSPPRAVSEVSRTVG